MKRILFAFLFLFSFVLTAGAQEQSYPEIVIDESGKITRETAELEPEDFVTARKAGDRMVKTVDGIEYAFRWCPAGTFTMGSPSSEPGRKDNETQHEVKLTRGFWMLETEVTQAMWKSVMGENPSLFNGAQKPVEYVSWNDCQTFCTKLSSKLSGMVSLPTEAQWEYACRAGTTGAYAGDLDAMGWYDSNSGEKTHPVGQKKPNAWGFTICTVTFGSGARTGTVKTTTPNRQRTTRQARILACTGSTTGVAGTPIPNSAALRSAASMSRSIWTASGDSVSF